MELESKHLERDLKIPRDRQTMLSQIEQDLINDENVLAVFYGGSIGKQNTDLYSDIDLRILVKDEVFEEYRLTKKERAKNWGNVLYFEDIPWATYTVAHYDSFIKVDAFYYKTEFIQPSTWLQNINIVYDKTGFMGEVLVKSEILSYSPSFQEVEIWRTKFFAYVHEAYRRVNRKEMFYALSCLDNLRLSMVTAWYMDKGLQPNAFGDWAKYEGERSELDSWQLSLLASWHSSREAHDLMNVIEKIIPEFKKTHKSLCEKVGIEENPEWVDEIFGMVF
ncbi:hypothetical protein N780_15745 [Pontibacillus chungwhensis BH030062]|uniref:Polymerase nucleotidyl transferase domain-containing protein n=1 Tax=Pontibacillus chungwhensis BH030062 TaxID=1385513 RepID=A0A0A2UV84_9BACI|nr:hypothetical protein [Pontibacillus chungwhensis]KGP91819.1 hypothetical protein N780_15745 [Pontibacillus chungwhensis BH030062]